MKSRRCPARAVWNPRFQCRLERGHKGIHAGPKRRYPMSIGKPIYVRVGFCHGVGERCNHL